MEKLKDLVRKRSSTSMQGRSRSIDQQPASRGHADLPTGKTRDAGHPDRDNDLSLMPPTDTTATRQPGSSTSLRSSSQWSNSGHAKSPISPAQWQNTPIAPASAIPERGSSLRVNRASPPYIEEDYDQYRNMLAKSAAGPQRGSRDTFHNASEESQTLMPRTDQQNVSREYGRRQIHATDGNHLNMQGLSIADNYSDIGRASTELTSMKQPNSSNRSSAGPMVNKQNATISKALPPWPQENISSGDSVLRQKPSNMNFQDQAQSQAASSSLPNPNRHSQPTTISPITTVGPNHTFSKSPHLDPPARLPSSFNPTNTIDTTVDTTVVPAITHEAKHMKHIEIVQEAITHDTHVHHYRHYIQPVKVVEVNPARHFKLNSKGEKVRIATPEGWQMPQDKSVTYTPDFVSNERSDAGEGTGAGGNLRWGRRDYVVDEENPQGRMLNAEELEQERVQGHLVSPVYVGVEAKGEVGAGAAMLYPALYGLVRGG